MIAGISRALLDAYLDDALNEADTARVEKALRESDALRRTLLEREALPPSRKR